ncbi:Eco57I restriction-modification methylase domain-containing protein [Salibacter halophilus]|uniref:site-specific DNA-methyltransferase (adenine-specific) n=1 Tax=Salibacter halophilus TaxID=1803916 RepID=A0A6N6M4G6_9FLAO|nr:TaqI-like C-terminal specificity domain-containing protein [Salibacter halophilus]KAB1062107.1 N-6 DNA methylase [Salibacter halophilus]
MKLTHFKDINFLPAIKALFKELNVPMNYVADEPTTAKEILKDTYKENETFRLVDDVYFVGMVDDAAFEGNQSLETEKIKSDYDGILIFGITLHPRPNNLLPTRSQLAEISRAFNREFYYTPVVLVFKYKDDQKNYLAFANTERLKYKQEWREGEKAGKVSLLRDIDIQKPHAGHERIIAELQIPLTGRNAVDSFAKLYNYWQEVFNVSILNKKFYQELSNWYFWAINHVKFPSEPTIEDAHRKEANLDDLIKEHNATNVIRLLTRLLFTWFIKEKKLVPDELFDLDALQKDILNEISPYHENGMFKDANKESVYYKAILQNLFFASLNCPIEADETDRRTRGFRELTTKSGKEARGKHQGIDYLMRYEEYFKDSEAFLDLMNKSVPFLNGGLFECLDDKENKILLDGFSDNLKGYKEQLIVPDYLFFGATEHVDLSPEYGVKNKGTKQAAVKGLINILHSYKFTVTENTPVEEDVALDPELLGKVFENLLASYNPETKTTARKQTGSFYTPREIVNYMVDESLIAYLKNAIKDWNLGDEELDQKLHQLSSFDPGNPFAEDEKLTKQIVKAIDECKILDPACGSGAFPMGILQKMVHMLQKLDPENIIWKEVQKNKAKQAADDAFEIEDKEERSERLREIDEAFDRSINDPDYARKLYLIENCIYGVDIQPIATQISKLRFFISLVVDQRKNNDKPNFGIRALPNLETKFVAANTLIGIDKPKDQLNIFDGGEIKKLESQLKKVRHKLFSARTKDTKLKYREKDEELRSAIADELKQSGWPNDTAEKLAAWDPYDQNASSTFFDPEWMFDVKAFDVVIGNPPYINTKSGIQSAFKKYYKERYNSATGQFDLFSLFIELSLEHSKILSLIVPKPIINNENYEVLRRLINDCGVQTLVTGSNIFENAGVESCIFITNPNTKKTRIEHFNFTRGFKHLFKVASENFNKLPFKIFNTLIYPDEYEIIDNIQRNSVNLETIIEIFRGVESGKKDKTINSNGQGHELLRGEDLSQFKIQDTNLWIDADFSNTSKFKTKELYKSPKLCIRRVGNKVTTAIDLKNKVSLNTVYNCHLKSGNHENYWGLCALLNSSLINYWFFKVYILDDVLFPYQRVSQLGKIPIKNVYEDSVLILLSKILHFNRDSLINAIVDSVVLNLYFSDHMKEREIDVLEFVERDMQKVMHGREFDSLDDAEKEKVIEQLHATWSDPENEAVKRMAQFKKKSPDILKPILES